ncbi:MAG: chloride channel protein [Anaerolineae bacterium]|nr:chloride channel protein [Anaerolineae bacterium]
MNDEPIQPLPYLKLLLLAALLGLISAGITFVFMALVNGGQSLVWEEAAAAVGLSAPIFTLLICTIGGLLVGVLVQTFGDHTGIFAEMMAEFGRNGRFNYHHAPGIVVTAFVSLVSGGSLGPEAPMADACGSAGTWLGDKLKLDERSTRSLGFSGLSGMLAAFITSPFGGALLGLESARAGISYPWTLFPSLVASAVATTVFVLLTGVFFGHLYVFPEYTPQLKDLLLAVPLGLLGALAGAIFIVAIAWLGRLMAVFKSRLILRGLIGGLVLGVAGALMPLVLFSGEEQTLVLIDNAGAIGVRTLIALAVVKLLVTAFLLVTGWKGGYIFPTMFAGVALGMAAHLLFPTIPMAVAVAATMGGAMVATMKAPIFSALFVLTMVQTEASPVIAIAVIVGLLATVRLSMTPKPANTPQA